MILERKKARHNFRYLSFFFPIQQWTEPKIKKGENDDLSKEENDAISKSVWLNSTSFTEYLI